MRCYSGHTVVDAVTKQPIKKSDYPCGKCPVCLQRKRNVWAYRLEYEWRSYTKGIFLTLTYNNEHYEEPNVKIIQDYIKRLRNEELSFRYYFVSEHGERSFRPHYHAILYGLSKKEHGLIVRDKWQPRGFVYMGNVNEKTIKYVTKYSLKTLLDGSEKYEDFSLMSRKPVLGHKYVDDMRDWHMIDPDNRLYMPHPTGYKVALHRGFRNKIYPEGYRYPLIEDEILPEEQLANVREYNAKCQHIKLCAKRNQKL